MLLSSNIHKKLCVGQLNNTFICWRSLKNKLPNPQGKNNDSGTSSVPVAMACGRGKY